jgi:hypothetical protein
VVDAACNSVYGAVYTNVCNSVSTNARHLGWFSVYSAVWNPVEDTVSSKINEYEY